MKTLLSDTRVQRLLLANVTGSIGSGITIIAVPWLLVQSPGGDRLYGYTTLATTIALFLFMPYYGTWLDRHSRKSMLLAGEAFGCLATLTMALWAFFSGEVHAWQLMTSYFCGMLYYTLHYPAKFAFVQQVFERKHYQTLTGLVEIQGQTASMIAGGLASLLIGHVSLSTILFIDAGSYLLSFLIQSTIPYVADHRRPGPVTGAWRAMAEGWRWLSERPRLTVFFLSTYLPFVAVMVGNYLLPIYVADVLNASSTVFGYGEVAFALGALAAGVFIPRLATQHGADQTIVVTMALFLVGLALLTLLHATPLFYVAMLLLGIGNAGSRVARAAVVLTRVPTHVIGRVQMFFSAFDRVFRTLLIYTATVTVAAKSAALGYGVLFIVIAGAFACMLASRSIIRAPAASAGEPIGAVPSDQLKN